MRTKNLKQNNETKGRKDHRQPAGFVRKSSYRKAQTASSSKASCPAKSSLGANLQAQSEAHQWPEALLSTTNSERVKRLAMRGSHNIENKLSYVFAGAM